MTFESKTEAPSRRRQRLARKKGSVARSRHLGRWLLLLAAGIFLFTGAQDLGYGMLTDVRHFLTAAFSPHTHPVTEVVFAKNSMASMLTVPLLCAAVILLVTALVQTGPRFVINPAPSPDPAPRAPARLAFFILRTAAACAAFVLAMIPALRSFSRMHAMSQTQILGAGFNAVVLVIFLFALFELIVAVIELFYLRWRRYQDLRMTRSERMLEEREESGDPGLRRARTKAAAENARGGS